MRSFTFDHSSGLEPAGLSQIDYTVEVIATVGKLSLKQAQSSFNLRLKNPCVDDSLVSIQAGTLADTSYILFEDKHSFGHDEFQIQTLPFQHDMCGTLSYKATFQGNEILTTSSYMTYDADGR